MAETIPEVGSNFALQRGQRVEWWPPVAPGLSRNRKTVRIAAPEEGCFLDQ